jgi:hypothetical protein
LAKRHLVICFDGVIPAVFLSPHDAGDDDQQTDRGQGWCNPFEMTEEVIDLCMRYLGTVEELYARVVSLLVVSRGRR